MKVFVSVSEFTKKNEAAKLSIAWLSLNKTLDAAEAVGNKTSVLGARPK
jgi:hypothetical protein